MAKRVYTADTTIKKLVIEDMAKIYVHFHKDLKLFDVVRHLSYRSRTDVGFRQMIDMIKDMAKRSKDKKIELYIKSIDLLMVFYKRGQK